MSSNNMYKELEQLKARVGWLDHLDTEEGRRMHANEALLVENEQLKEEKDRLAHALAGAWEANSKHRDEIEQLKAETKKLKESDKELKEEIKYILHNCQPLSVLSTQEKLHWVTCSINMWSKLT